MNWEIEIKAHIEDPAEVEKRILALGGTFKRTYTKADRYFAMPSQPQEFRLRLDGSTAIVTFKDKTRKDGLEMNREGEFTVSDPENFVALVARLGAELVIEKHKTGKAFVYEDLLLELSEVAGLGHFLEVEAVFEENHQDKEPEFIARTETRLYGVLEALEIPKRAVEPRPYTQMLRNIDRPEVLE